MVSIDELPIWPIKDRRSVIYEFTNTTSNAVGTDSLMSGYLEFIKNLNDKI